MSDQSETTPHPSSNSPTPPTSRRSPYYMLAVIAVAIATAAGLIWYMQTSAPAPNKAPAQSASAPATKKPADDPALKTFLEPTTGETWYAQAKTIAAQGYFKKENPDTYNDGTLSPDKLAEALRLNTPEYSEVGTHGANTIVLAVTEKGMGGALAFLFEKTPAGEVSYITRPQTSDGALTEENRQYFRELFASKVTRYDESTHYESLSLPGWFVLDNGEKVTRTEWSGTGTKDMIPQTNVTKIKVADYGRNKLYRVETTYKDTDLTNIGYYLESVLGMQISLDYTPNTNSSEKYSWNNQVAAKGPAYDGRVVFDEFRAVAQGCGRFMAAVTRADTVKLSDLQPAGKTDTGRMVYQFKDTTHRLVKKAYDEYAQWQKTMDKTAITVEEFVKQHGLVVIQNASGDFLVYTRQQLAPAYGCAKPVVYLYPSTAQSVDVRVGADVKVSEPLYPSGGWRNVWAEPSGALTYQGVSYESLFWEGPGYGVYPSIVNGTVVRRADAERTMWQQLAQQGLQAKEIADFMAFWTPRIPDKPYIRLTWLTTAQMNQLAPLTVLPRPDTVIRVFLDMSGYDESIALPRQLLAPAPARHGFTVVEWGGVSPMMR